MDHKNRIRSKFIWTHDVTTTDTSEIWLLTWRRTKMSACFFQSHNAFNFMKFNLETRWSRNEQPSSRHPLARCVFGSARTIEELWFGDSSRHQYGLKYKYHTGLETPMYLWKRRVNYIKMSPGGAADWEAHPIATRLFGNNLINSKALYMLKCVIQAKDMNFVAIGPLAAP